MNELIYSFISSLRAWLDKNETVFQANNIHVESPAYILHYGTSAHFTSDRFEAGFYVWEKCSRSVAMSDVEFADWRIALRDPKYQIENTHYEYAKIDEMLEVLDALRDRLVLVQQNDL